MTDPEKVDRPYNGSDGRFRPGNPGRPIGSKQRLGTQLLDDFCVDWAAHGAAVLSEVRKNRPTEYLRIAAMLVPTELTIFNEGGDFAHLSDEELNAEIAKAVAEFQAEKPKAETPGKPRGRG